MVQAKTILWCKQKNFMVQEKFLWYKKKIQCLWLCGAYQSAVVVGCTVVGVPNTFVDTCDV